MATRCSTAGSWPASPTTRNATTRRCSRTPRSTARSPGKVSGSVLARKAIEDAVGRERVIRPVCPFIKAYLDKHPQYDAHVIGKGVDR
uniref:N-acetyltransferase n=1 Tax=Nocardia gamkensis TaxID=352869 RepID=UPI00350E420B